MSEELLQRDLIHNPEKIGKWDFYRIGSTTIKALKEYGIIRNVDYGNIEKKKPDALVVRKKKVIAVIEYKKKSEFKTSEQKNKAIRQELDVASRLSAPILVATDTEESVWINVATRNRIKDENGSILKVNFDPKDEFLPDLIEKIIDSINEKNDRIKPRELVNPTDLATRIWQDIWSVSGATPESCLYTFVELFIFKYLSDLGVLQGIYSFNTVIHNFSTNSDDEILENYANIIRPKIKDLFPENPIDKTTIINGTIFVSKDQKAVKGYSSVFKKVLLKFKDYGKLENIDYDFKSKLFESFLKESISKKNWGQFFTPLKVVRAIIKMADDYIKPGIKICDPACGVGKFLLEPVLTKFDRFYEVKSNEIISKITIHGFDKGFDKDEQKTIILAKANMLIYFSDLVKKHTGLTKEFSKLFNESFTLKTNSILGTLSEPVVGEYGLILTNPPYVTSGSSNLKEEIKKDRELLNHYKINAMGVEGLFMEWIIRALTPGGKAFVVVPDGIFNRQNDKNLRRFIIDECVIDGIISLPLNTFFTTNKKTYILCLTKKDEKKEIQKTPVFTYLVSEIGESRDVYRFSIEQDDLSEAVDLFSFFKGNKSGFDKINPDKRCKIFPFYKFSDSVEQGWIIDKWWTEEEKIELGISGKKDTVGLFELSVIIEDIATSIKEFKEEIHELSEKKKSTTTKRLFKLTDLFYIDKGKSKYTKKYGDANKGNFPVYSASNHSPLTFINTFDYNGRFLTWATNGFAGYMMLIDGKFSINADRGLLRSKHENINLQFIKAVLEPKLRELAKGRMGENGNDEFTKVYPSMIEDLKIEMFVDENGDFDVEKQIEISERYEYIINMKTTVENYKKQIEELVVDIEGNYSFREEKINDLFIIEKGKSRYTNKFIVESKGTFPLFSSQTTNGGIIGNINIFDYDCNAITWTTDGAHAGTVFIRSGKFSMTTHCGALILKSDVNGISLDYVYYYLRNNLKRFAIGEQNKRITTTIIRSIGIPIPINSNKDFDLSAQKQIAEKYKKIEQIRRSILDELDKIINVDVSFE
jgi:type I restriction-modification system DNA methylase subunit